MVVLVLPDNKKERYESIKTFLSNDMGGKLSDSITVRYELFRNQECNFRIKASTSLISIDTWLFCAFKGLRFAKFQFISVELLVSLFFLCEHQLTCSWYCVHSSRGDLTQSVSELKLWLPEPIVPVEEFSEFWSRSGCLQNRYHEDPTIFCFLCSPVTVHFGQKFGREICDEYCHQTDTPD